MRICGDFSVDGDRAAAVTLYRLVELVRGMGNILSAPIIACLLNRSLGADSLKGGYGTSSGEYGTLIVFCGAMMTVAGLLEAVDEYLPQATEVGVPIHLRPHSTTVLSTLAEACSCTFHWLSTSKTEVIDQKLCRQKPSLLHPYLQRVDIFPLYTCVGTDQVLLRNYRPLPPLRHNDCNDCLSGAVEER